MKYLKLALISFVFFFLLITAFSLLIPSNVNTSRAIDVNVDQAAAVKFISNPGNLNTWYPGADSTKVDLQITEVTDSSILAIFRNKRRSTQWLVIPSSKDQVTIQWSMQTRLRWYLWEKFSSLLFEKQFGTQMEISLTRLKAALENK